MTPQELKASILQLAIQGKLVDQRPEEGTGEELYQQIQIEKQRLIKAGTIKKEKPLPEIAEDEIPFDIPESWKWVRWGDLSQSIQYGYNAPAQEKGRIKMVRISDIQDGKVLWDTVPYCDIKENEIPTYLLEANDILFARTGGTVGKSYLVKDVPEEAIYAGYLIRTQYSSLLCPEYMKHFMESQLYWDQLRNGTIATAQPNCNGKTLSKMVLPLPPLAEQKRIVAKIEELLPFIDRYEKAWSKLEDFNKRFPVDMQKSILQMAIQGKLVEQRPEEGTGEELYQQIQAEKQRLIKAGTIKKEKPLPKLTEDEIPFDIPKSWRWVRLADLVEIYTGKRDANFGSPDGQYDFFTCSNKPIKCKSYSYDGEYLIMPGNGANIGMVIHYDGKFEAYQRTYLLENIYDIYMDYLKYHLEANWKQYNADKMYGSAIPYIKLGNLTNYCVALPPLAEQKRIVAKLEEILPLCDRLK